MDQTGQKWHKFLPRAALVGSLLKHCKDHLKIRAELRDFIRDMKKDSEQTTAELREEDPTLREWYVRRRSNAATVGLTHRDFLASKKVSLVTPTASHEIMRKESSLEKDSGLI